MTLAEAGRRGGEKVKRERGSGFFAEIGRKGGRRVTPRPEPPALRSGRGVGRDKRPVEDTSDQG